MHRVAHDRNPTGQTRSRQGYLGGDNVLLVWLAVTPESRILAGFREKYPSRIALRWHRTLHVDKP